MSKPNILLAISDDQSWPFAGAYGCRFVHTPAFDRIAREGALLNNAYCPAPQCAPSRASLLTGRHIWQNEEAGTHAAVFPAKLQVYPDLLENAGYRVGFTGKPWGPGDWQSPGRPRNPAGDEFSELTCTPPTSGISAIDYAQNFKDFLAQTDDSRPFCFWFGAREPHRPYEKDSGLRTGKQLADVDVPPFLPDNEIVRSDLLDYAREIEWFDYHLGLMMQTLEERNMLDNTLIVVTSDNGMPFPRAKANNYELGVHVPMAVRWKDQIPPGRTLDDFVSLADLAPTFIAAAGMEPPQAMSAAKSMLPILTSEQEGLVDQDRGFTLTGRERHTHARRDNLGYPVRAIHTTDYTYIRNFKPDLWPAGEQLHDCDPGPAKELLVDNQDREDIRPYYKQAFEKRPEEELFDRAKDPYCLTNVAQDPTYKEVRESLCSKLDDLLKAQGDPRVLGFGDIFDAYPRISNTRPFLGGFAEKAAYNGAYLQKARQAMAESGYSEEDIAEYCDNKSLPTKE